MDIIQKLILFGIFILAGSLMYVAVPVKSRIARTMAGLIYLANPWVYDRFMAGHWLLLVGYALTPLALLLFIRLFKTPSWKNLGWTTLAWSGITVFSPHHLMILGFLYVGLALALVRQRRTLLFAIMLPLAVLLTSSWWIVFQITGHSVIESFSLEQWYAFATLPDSRYGLLAHMLSLQGFWHRGWIELDQWTWWPIAWFAAVLPALIGLSIVLSKPKSTSARIVIGLVIASFGALLIAAGPTPGLYQFNTWIFIHIPGISGLREPEKLLSLLALTYAYLTAVGLELAQAISSRLGWVILILVTLGIIAWSWPLWWGGHGQLRPVDYPPTWYALNHQLKIDKTSYVLILPWEQYLDDTFAPNLIASPGTAFFGQRAIQSNELELPNLLHQGDYQYPQIQQLLLHRDAKLWQQTLLADHITFLLEIKNQKNFDDNFLISSGVATVYDHDSQTRILRLTNIQ